MKPGKKSTVQRFLKRRNSNHLQRDQGRISGIRYSYYFASKTLNLRASFPPWQCFIPVNVALLRLPSFSFARTKNPSRIFQFFRREIVSDCSGCGRVGLKDSFRSVKMKGALTHRLPDGESAPFIVLRNNTILLQKHPSDTGPVRRGSSPRPGFHPWQQQAAPPPWPPGQRCP